MSEYEYARPITIGGAAGTYILASPWGPQACEYALGVISTSGAGGLCIATDALSAIAVSDTTATNVQGGYVGELINFHAAGTIPPAAIFSLCPGGTLVLTVTGASHILTIIRFRRQLGVAHLPQQVYHINPDTTPQEAIHAQRERDMAAYLANPAKSEGA